ncbi:hypothetical protein L6164_006787 [Bauhinia variegata]|uniref:Uncharacterized protein n=1 Tax=Bauhinia variegata TaxID=167791 RepID=A0ACB9PVK0_BAUVA|nr:hypothetical protein L6164_006787 [Bauhinia variegata]
MQPHHCSFQGIGQIIGWKVCWRNWEVAHARGMALAVHAQKKKPSGLISGMRNSSMQRGHKPQMPRIKGHDEAVADGSGMEEAKSQAQAVEYLSGSSRSS